MFRTPALHRRTTDALFHLTFVCGLYHYRSTPPKLLHQGSSVWLFVAEAFFVPPPLPYNMISRFCETASTSWVAVVVRSRAERRVQTGLAAAGLETFVPWYKVRRNWSDRIKALEHNLFPGYIFCRSTYAQRHLVMSQPGVERVVSFDRQPAIIPDEEIVALRRTVESGLPMLPWPFLKAGQRVRIDRGVLEGIEGALARDSNSTRIVVSVDVLQRSVAIEVDRDMICPIPLGVSHSKSLYSIRPTPTHPGGVQSHENRSLNRWTRTLRTRAPDMLSAPGEPSHRQTPRPTHKPDRT